MATWAKIGMARAAAIATRRSHHSVANGIVVYARDFHVGWGNVVIIRHAYTEDGEVKYVDSLYGHLLNFSVREGQIVRRGELIGSMGNNAACTTPISISRCGKTWRSA